MSDPVAGRALPVKGDLVIARISSLVIALAVAAVSLAGLAGAPTASTAQDHRSRRSRWAETPPT